VSFVVGIGGTLRPGSSSELLARAVLDACGAMGAETQMFDGPTLALMPHFDPSAGDRNRHQAELVEAVRRADAIVIASPGYHGGVSGLVKNAIDLLEDLREDARPYFDGRPVGLIVSAAGWQAGGVILSSLRDIVHAMRGWPAPIGIAINSAVQKPFGADGKLADPAVQQQIVALAQQLLGTSQPRSAVA
jgi:FMN reductase